MFCSALGLPQFWPVFFVLDVYVCIDVYRVWLLPWPFPWHLLGLCKDMPFSPSPQFLSVNREGGWGGGEKQADKTIVWPDNVLMIWPERIASLRLPFQSPPATRENSLQQSNQVN